MTSPCRVNIIFVPGTVEPLLPLLRSVLHESALAVRLVANGCSGAERARLERTAREHPGAEYLAIDDAAPLPHGVVLDRLLERERSPWFAFMDSDIFAIGPLSVEALLPGAGEAGVNGCLPVWHEPRDRVLPDDFLIMGGRFVETASGIFLGCTYLGCYRAETLRALLREEGVSFEQRHAHQLPDALRERLRRLDRERTFYDSGKIVNLLLHERGERVVYRSIDNLVHLGGVSGLHDASERRLAELRHLAKRLLPRGLVLRFKARYRSVGSGRDPIEVADGETVLARRRAVSRLLERLRAGPPYPPELARRLRRGGYEHALAHVLETFAEPAEPASP